MQREDPRAQLAREWLTRADHDLEAAQLLITNAGLAAETGFHAQQAAEKILKGLLAFNDREFPKTHALALLLDLCVDIASELLPFREDISALTRFAVQGRYPGSGTEPTAAESAQALTLAHTVREIARSMIPPDGHP